MATLDPAQFSPMSPEFRANPYPYYHWLRDNAPVFQMPGWNLWFLTRYDDVSALLRDPRFGHATWTEQSAYQPPESQRPLWEMQSQWMLFRNPPDHTRLRGLVHKAFTPRMIEQLRCRVEAIANELLDAVEGRGEIDLIADFAYPLPVTVIGEMLGVPKSDQELFKRWSRDLIGTLDLDDRMETYERGSRITVEFVAYFNDLIEARRRQPQDDLLSALIAAEEQGDHLTAHEMIATLILLLVAGHETTMNLIGNGTQALLQNPDQFAVFQQGVGRGDAALTRTAVEELLRYDSPVQFTSRVALEDVEIQGQLIRRGNTVGTMLGAANRDPAQFPNPDHLDITRADNRHVAFGSGIHYCLGAPLARLEGAIAFNTLLRRLPGMRLAQATNEYRDTYVIRGLKTLPLTF